MSEIVDKAKALVSTYEQLLEHTRTERDTLRAELAAVKNLLARIHRDGGHHTEAVGVAQSVADADGKVLEWLLAVGERDALAADNARLRKALETIANDGIERSRDPRTVIAQSALAANPAQSIAAQALEAWAWQQERKATVQPYNGGWLCGTIDNSGHADTPLGSVLAAMEGERDA